MSWIFQRQCTGLWKTTTGTTWILRGTTTLRSSAGNDSTGWAEIGSLNSDQVQLCRLFTCESNMLDTSKRFEIINLVRIIYTCQGDPKNVVGTFAWAAASRRGSGGGASSFSHGPTVWEVRKDTRRYIFSHPPFFLSSLGFWGVCYYPFDILILVAIPSARLVSIVFYFSTKKSSIL